MGLYVSTLSKHLQSEAENKICIFVYFVKKLLYNYWAICLIIWHNKIRVFSYCLSKLKQIWAILYNTKIGEKSTVWGNFCQIFKQRYLLLESLAAHVLYAIGIVSSWGSFWYTAVLRQVIPKGIIMRNVEKSAILKKVRNQKVKFWATSRSNLTFWQ